MKPSYPWLLDNGNGHGCGDGDEGGGDGEGDGVEDADADGEGDGDGDDGDGVLELPSVHYDPASLCGCSQNAIPFPL